MYFYSLRANPSGTRITLVIVSGMAALGDWFAFGGVVGQTLATGYPTTPAVITRSTLLEHKGSKGGKSYSLELAYDYVVDGHRYTGTRRRYYEMKTSDRHFWSNLQLDYPIDRVVSAAYNPSDPADAILTPGIEPTDWVRSLLAISASLLLFGAWLIVMRSQPEFDVNDPHTVFETETGWEARLPEVSHLRVFTTIACGFGTLGA